VMMDGGGATNSAPNLSSTLSRGYASYINRNSTDALYNSSHIATQPLVIHQLLASNKGLRGLYSDEYLSRREAFYLLASKL
jgi:hypothetical protein